LLAAAARSGNLARFCGSCAAGATKTELGCCCALQQQPLNRVFYSLSVGLHAAAAKRTVFSILSREGNGRKWVRERGTKRRSNHSAAAVGVQLLRSA